MQSLKGKPTGIIIAELWVHAEKMEVDQINLIERLENCCRVFDLIEKENKGVEFRIARQLVEARYNARSAIQKLNP